MLISTRADLPELQSLGNWNSGLWITIGITSTTSTTTSITTINSTTTSSTSSSSRLLVLCYQKLLLVVLSLDGFILVFKIKNKNENMKKN